MNAIILCAGRGVRFRPLSLVRPKSLTPVDGVPLLEHTLGLLRRHGVERITVVTGYMADHFQYLKDAFSVELIRNPLFAATNNNTSLALVRDRLQDSLIIDGDLFFLEDFLPHVRPDHAQFISQPTTHGLEWELRLDAARRVVEVRKWSPTGYGMVGVSYWTGDAARRLAEELPHCAPDEYWEDAALRVLPRCPVYAACLETPFVRELDTVKDALDFRLLTHEQIAHQCSVDFTPVKLKGLTNNTWLVRNRDGELRTLRVPGAGTEAFIHREHEPLVLEHLRDLNITPSSRFYPGGLKTTHFLKKHRVSTFQDMEPRYFAQLAACLHRLHSIEHTPQDALSPLYIKEEMALYEARSGRALPPQERSWLAARAEYFDARPQVLCHRDLLPENILVSGAHGADMQLIDFEYAGFTDALWDVASFILESGIEGPMREAFITACGITDVTEKQQLFQMEILVDYIWGLWGLVNNYGDYGENRLARARLKLRTVL